jgi:hypothetical protein
MENYTWPQGALLSITDEEGNLMCKSRDQSFDLSDNVMHFFDGSPLTVLLSLSNGDKEYWTDGYLKEIENLISYDLSFDGYSVVIKRLSEVSLSCDSAFYWKLLVSVEE